MSQSSPTDKHCEHEAPPKPGPERDRYIHEHDCPRIWEFWKKYALGSKLCPSCLLCGVQAFDPEDWAIRHAELPDIYICKGCAEKARAPSSTSSSERVPICGTKGATVSRAIWDEAWIAYEKKYSGGESQHKRLLREGFYAEELDTFRPGWRPVDQRIAALEATLSATASAEVPAELFDGYAVYKELRSRDATGLSIPPEAVSEVLDAAVRLIRNRQREQFDIQREQQEKNNG